MCNYNRNFKSLKSTSSYKHHGISLASESNYWMTSWKLRLLLASDLSDYCNRSNINFETWINHLNRVNIFLLTRIAQEFHALLSVVQRFSLILRLEREDYWPSQFTINFSECLIKILFASLFVQTLMLYKLLFLNYNIPH